jgi:hypothetical protein
MKRAIAECFFPELKGGHVYGTGRGDASNIPAAISRAFKDALAQKKGKRVHTIKATITIIDVQPEEDTNVDKVQGHTA